MTQTKQKESGDSWRAGENMKPWSLLPMYYDQDHLLRHRFQPLKPANQNINAYTNKQDCTFWPVHIPTTYHKPDGLRLVIQAKVEN